MRLRVKDRKYYFGKIVNQKMELSKMGDIVVEEWKKTKEIRKNVDLDYWVVMPNHLHGILIITGSSQSNVETHNVVETHCSASLHCASLQHRDILVSDKTQYQNRFGPQRNNLSSIIRGFKSITTKRIHVAGFSNFSWQPRFHDHIIRNEKSYQEIRRYIFENPARWLEDESFLADYSNIIVKICQAS